MYTRAVALVGRMGIQFRPGNSEFFRGHLICSGKIIGFFLLVVKPSIKSIILRRVPMD